MEKQAGRKANRLLPTSTEVRNDWVCTDSSLLKFRGTYRNSFSFIYLMPRKIFIVVLSDIAQVSLNNEILINEFVM